MLYNIEYSLNVCLSGCMLDLKIVSLLSAQYFKLLYVYKKCEEIRGIDLIYCSSA